MKVNTQEMKYISELLDITARMLSAFNLHKLLRQILETSLNLLNADTGSLMLLEDESKTLKIKAARGLAEDITQKVSVKVGEHISGWVAKHGEPLLLVGGLRGDPRFNHLDEKKEIKSSICVPLKVENRVIGVLNLNSLSHENLFSELDLKLVSLLANQSAISIFNVRLYEEAKKATADCKTMQQKLIEREKVAALGQLSTAIAHEINNPLAVILGNVQYLTEHIGENSFGWEEIKDIKEAAELSSRIISRLFKYTRPSEEKEQLLDVNDILSQTTELIKTQFEREGILVKLNLKTSLPKILISADEFKEVILNIVFNARSAMPNGGVLTIETNYLEPDGLVEVVFADTGVGIPENTIDKIFDPFFTTRRPQGSGLGLTICQRIVNFYGGLIKVNSEVGKGTTFVIKLPASKATK
jgi:signal transduction histidine kinase